MRVALIAAALAALFFAGCSGGGGSSAPTSPSGPTGPTSSSQSVTLTVVIGGTHKDARRSIAARGRKFVSPSTNGLDINVYAHGSTTLVGETAADISSGSTACGGTTGTPRTCTVNVPAPPGADDFVVTNYDAAPVSGSFASANELGIGKLTYTIVKDANNALVIYIGGLIATLGYLAPSVSEPADGASHDFAVILNPQDFDNNAITAGANDPYANPITVSLAETGGTGHASLVLNGTVATTSSVTITKSTDTLAVRYDGGATPGYYVGINAAATGVTSEKFTLAPLFVTSTNPNYASGNLTLTGTGSSVVLALGETMGPATQYTVTPAAACSTIATATTPAAGENSTTTVSGQSVGGSCTIAITDGMSTLTVSIDNTVTTGTVTVPGTTTGPITFAGDTLGPVRNVTGWYSNSCGGNDYDANVVTTGPGSSYAAANWPGTPPTQALQIDNVVTQGCFSGLGSPITGNSSGYANALSDTSVTPPISCGPQCQPFFTTQFVVTSATGAYQPAMGMSISPVWTNQGARMQYIGLWHTQDPSGNPKLLIFTYDVEGVAAPATAPCYQCANFVGYEVAYVDPTVAHTVGMTLAFNPPGSDVAKFYVDGVAVGSTNGYRSWEDYYLYDTESDPNSAYPYSRAVNDLLFRPGNFDGCKNFADLQGSCTMGTQPSHTTTGGEGFLFDQITTCSGSVSSCKGTVTGSERRRFDAEPKLRKIRIPLAIVNRT